MVVRQAPRVVTAQADTRETRNTMFRDVLTHGGLVQRRLIMQVRMLSTWGVQFAGWIRNKKQIHNFGRGEPLKATFCFHELTPHT